MAVTRYIANNKKKTAVFFCILLTLSVIVGTLIHAMRTNAGVFIKDKEGDVVQTNEINVLEIVAEEGQQVLGYTVEGEEPISIDDINNYAGEAIDTEDFKDATGYIIEETTPDSDGKHRYKVKSSVLNKTFNQNVLGDSMAKGEIYVNVVQAKDVTLADINKANLIFINSNDYNDNLMYYYDQFVHNGELKYEKGYKGKDYTYKEVKTELISDIAIKKICSAAGNKTLAHDLTADDFKNAGVTGYDDKFLALYQSYISDKCEKECFNAGKAEESLEKINTALNTAVSEEQDNAFNYIKETVINDSYVLPDGVTEDMIKENVKYYLTVGGWDNCIEENIDYYMEQFKAAEYDKVKFSWSLQEFITNGNGKSQSETIPKLYEIKEDAMAQVADFESNHEDGEEFKYNISDENRENFIKYIHMIGISNINDEYIEDYITSFGSKEFNMTNPKDDSGNVIPGNINKAYQEILDMIQGINNAKYQWACQLIADSVGSDEIYEQLTEDASYIFRSAKLLYTEDNIYQYLDGISELKDNNDYNHFKNSDNGEYDIVKIQDFITGIDNENKQEDKQEVEESYDLSWQAAMGIYEYAMKNSGGLMYNTELLTNKTLGDYTDTEKTDNTNNLYKLLMISRQLKPDYYMEHYADKVDDYGVYYEGGLDENTGKGPEGETGINSWDKQTFGTDYDNVSEKYHEPDVVGDTYLDNGEKGANTNYVYKHIYSFTGSQFLGGKKFVATDMDGNDSTDGVLTANAKYTYIEDMGNNDSEDDAITDNNKYIYLCTNDYSWSTAYVYMWGDNVTGASYQMESLGDVNHTFKATIPGDKKYTKMLFYRNNINDNRNKTVDMSLPSEWNETEYYLGYNSSNDNDNLRFRTYILTNYDKVYGLSGDRIYLDTSKLGWSQAYAHFWDNRGNTIRPDLQKMSYDSTKKLYYIQVPQDAKNVLFRNTGTWYGSGVNSQNIKLPDNRYNNGHIYYLEYTDAVNNKINISTSRFSDKYYNNSTFRLTNAKENERVEFGNQLTLKFTGHNIKNIRYMVDNGSWFNVNVGDEVTIGDGTTYDRNDGNDIRFDVRYVDSSNSEIIKTYYFKKLSLGSVTITNFIENDTVEFRGSMDVTVRYHNVTNVKYSIDGGEYTPVENEAKINIGSDAQEDGTISITFEFVNSKGEVKNVTSYMHKQSSVQANDDANYLSRYTASSVNESKLGHHDGISDDATKGEVIRYIMDVSLLELSYPVRILDIEPAASTSTLDNLAKAKELAGMMGLEDIKNKLNDNPESKDYYKKYFNITSMSVREFNSRSIDLTADYDLIYMGIDSGYVKLASHNGVKRTDYNDNSMDGLVYTGIGDLYKIWAFLKGTAAEDYTTVSNISSTRQKQEHKVWVEDCFDGFTDNPDSSWNLDKNKLYTLENTWSYTRLSPTDLTVKSMNSLIDYVKSGYPVLLADEIMYCDDSKYIAYDGNDANAAKWRYVDPDSKMYNFIQIIKNLGKDNSGKYTGKDENGNDVFLDGKTYPSIVSWSDAKNGRNPENLPDNKKLKGGLQFALKRIAKVNFELIKKPTEYTDNVNGTTLVGSAIKKNTDEYREYSYLLKVKGNYTQEWMEENYSYQLYVDKSGVGKFIEDQTISLDPGVKYNINDKGYVDTVEVYGKWPEGLEGFIPWKIEAFSNANRQVKFSYTGYSAFEKISSNKKDVYVLWVRTEHDKDKPFNVNFTDFVRENEGYIDDFKIHILSMTYSEFVQMYSNSYSTGYGRWNKWSAGTDYTKENSFLKVNKAASYLKSRFGSYTGSGLNVDGHSELDIDKEFNMIVFGYADSYNGQDLNDRNLLNDLKRYVDAGNSLLFAHDGASYLSTMNYYKNTSGSHIRAGESDWNWGRYTTSYLRELLGMDVYGITKSSSRLSDSQVNARMYLSEDTKQSDLRGYTESTIFHYEGDVVEQSGGGGKNGNQLYTNRKHSTDGVADIKSWVYTFDVRKINRGQITEYPFVTGNNTAQTISTKETHAQYMQLDMEDEGITVWYTLNSGSGYYMYTNGDGSNNYYIYSNGNVTYTGAGHSTEGLTNEEKKLFINTIISALKLGNLEPAVTFPYAYSKVNTGGDAEWYMDYYPDEPDSKGFVLTFRATDYDTVSGAAGTFSKCKIYIDRNNNKQCDSGDIILNDTSTSEGYGNYSKYISDVNTLAPVTINAGEIKNRENISLLISKENINEIGKILNNNAGSEEDWLNAFCSYNIMVEVTDNGSLTKADSQATVSNGVKVVKQEYKAPDLFNLN